MVGGDLINTVPFILVAVTAYLSTLAMYVPTSNSATKTVLSSILKQKVHLIPFHEKQTIIMVLRYQTENYIRGLAANTLEA